MSNDFDWSEYSKKLHPKMRKYINADPYGCDLCGDTYNKNDLEKLEDGRICRNCL